MTEIQNPKQKNNVFVYGPEGTGYKFEICNLFGICLSASFLAGCLEFVILDTKLQGRAGAPEPIIFTQ